ncbi:MAG: hypothetical protein U0736_23560 [Gemmataceae bacterium]
MTEEEWQSATDPAGLLDWLERGFRCDGRKRRLFVAAACRLAWTGLRPDVQRLVEAAEDVADAPPFARVRLAGSDFYDALLALRHERLSGLEEEVRGLACWAFHGVGPAVTVAAAVRGLCPPVTPALLADRVRELFGNPFRPIRRVGALLHARVAAWPAHRQPKAVLFVREWQSWQDGTVVRLARAIHAERAYDRLPILADALEDAGCTDATILDHCRRPGGHVRGCWLLDVLLDRTQ